MKTSHVSFKPTALASALALALAACGGSSDAGSASANAQRVAAVTAAPGVGAGMTEAEMIDEVAANLQACSYDGSPVAFSAAGMAMGVNADGRDVVAEIMKFTGLPQNFEVVEHSDVPNAAAVILLGPDKLPRRVIAYNPGFMNDVRRATADNNWAPISIMAHEIGHHLSGHTIQPGGSQPPTELEADKFSGYVLYKMGAVLADAQKAMNTLVPESGGKTHPGRTPRVRAIEDGWKQACSQQSKDCDGLLASATSPPRTKPASAPVAASSRVDDQPSTPARVPAATTPATSRAPMASPRAGAPLIASVGQVDVLPAPSGDAIAAKFDKFIYDEMGMLDATWRAKFEREMYDHAQQHGVEIVTLLVKDLHGLSGDQYAHAMMRQLRVGKLDVGNGAVLVVAPGQNEVGIAMGPGVGLEMEFHDKKTSLQRWLENGWPECARKGDCGNWSENFMSASDHIRRDTDQIEWTIRYQSLAEAMSNYSSASEGRQQVADGHSPDADPGYRKITRIEGQVVSLDPPLGNKAAWVNGSIVARGRKAVQVQSGSYTVMLYLDPHTEVLMPGGKLVQGKSYTFIARSQGLSRNPKDTQAFHLLSYDEGD